MPAQRTKTFTRLASHPHWVGAAIKKTHVSLKVAEGIYFVGNVYIADHLALDQDHVQPSHGALHMGKVCAFQPLQICLYVKHCMRAK